MKADQLKRLKELEKENQRLRRAVSDLALDKVILKGAARGNFFALRVAAAASITCGKSPAFRSAAPAARSVSIDPRSARPRADGMTKPP